MIYLQSLNLIYVKMKLIILNAIQRTIQKSLSTYLIESSEFNHLLGQLSKVSSISFNEESKCNSIVCSKCGRKLANVLLLILHL